MGETAVTKNVDHREVKSSLESVLMSSPFRATAQCSSLLRYIVENTLAERDENLRERVIGCEVFHRAPDYDTGNDHVVRSRAAEVRKRLALYYQEAGHTDGVRISVPSGSYRAVFELAPRGEEPASETHTQASVLDSSSVQAKTLQSGVQSLANQSIQVPVPIRHRMQLNVWRAVAFLALLTCFFLAIYPRHHTHTEAGTFGKFWAPLRSNPKPALIYCGGGFVYKLSDTYLVSYKQQHGVMAQQNEFFVNLQPEDTIKGSDLLLDKHFVPFGDLAAAARVTSMLAEANKPYNLRYGEDVAFTELHSSPVILIGGLNNTWALRITHDLRYVLNGDDRIVDRADPHTVWEEHLDLVKQSRDDYAVISWLNQSDTGGFVLSIAGIRAYANRAAADLLADPIQLDRILAKAPAGWEKRNLQIVIHTRTVSDIPVAVDVLAVHFW